MKPQEKPYPDVDPSPDFPKLEERVLELWKKEKTFVASVENRPAKQDGKTNEFIFYDGPPFANGLPHYGHLLTGFVKDAVARYQTMRGHRVERRFGWDCHGLPAEMGVEKEIGVSGHQAIMKYGMAKFNDHCRTSVMKYTREWEYYVTRQARWVDFAHDYKTMDKTYMESVLWAFKQLYDKGWVYEAYRVMPYSWAAETPLSNFETRLDNSYRERADKAITVAFELKEKPKGAPDAEKYYILAWTTTPWTLPSNLALAVNAKLEYSFRVLEKETINPNLQHLFKEADKICLILSVNSLHKYANEFPVVTNDLKLHKGETCIGADLIGLTYKPLFPYFTKAFNAFQILDGSEFVTDVDGTGVVHMAPGFGEDDQKLCEKYNIGEYEVESIDNIHSIDAISSIDHPTQFVCPVDRAGRFTNEIFDITKDNYPDLPPLSLKGMNVIEENVEKFKFGEANELITKWLKDHGQLIKADQIVHNYPHCWRTDKPLIYRAMPSWYVEVTKFRDRMVELNQQINWIPENVRDGLFGKWLENARDWSISRNRFWGTPIPVWRSASGKIKVYGSIAELEKASGQKITELHRPFIDEIVITEGGEEYRRVNDVFDCWFESGSMPFAQVHYPFDNKEWFEKHFPADFIVEYAAQTRGWFYTLMVLGTALFDKPPFKNCICHGVVLDDKGQKLSKRLNNYADPKEIFDQFGADALRWFMLSSPVMRGLELHIDKEGKFIRDVVRLAIKPIWNAYNFFCMYANADGVKAKLATASSDIMDRYILAKCSQSVEAVRAALDAYDTPAATEAVSQFFETLNNWYIRRSKERFWKEEKDADKQAAYDTLYTVLHIMCRAAAPLLPLTLEEIYRGLTGEKSVHLTDFPSLVVPAQAGTSLSTQNNVAREIPAFAGMTATTGDEKIIRQMDIVRDICNAALAIRNRKNLRVRQPLLKLSVLGIDEEGIDAISKSIIMDEVNVKNIEIKKVLESYYATHRLQINFPLVGKRIPEKIKQIIPASKKAQFQWSPKGDGSIIIANEELKSEEFALILEPSGEYKDHAQALSTNNALVILDTTITPELEAEGYARDLVRLIQQARKDAGLHVSDRIQLRLRVSEKLGAVLAAHRDYIMAQVLASSLDVGDMLGCMHIANETIDNEDVSIGIRSQAAA